MAQLIAYKLTDANDRTHGGCQWGPGVTHTTSGEGELCGPGWIHVYSDPLLAVALNPIHAGFQEPHLWRCEVSGKEKHDGVLKSGYTEVTTVERMELPLIPTAALARWGIVAALRVCSDAAFKRWAKAWLSGADRSRVAAEAAAATARWAATEAAARAAAWASVRASVRAAEAAAWAAWAAVEAARAAVAAWVAQEATGAESDQLPLASLLRQAIAEEEAMNPSAQKSSPPAPDSQPNSAPTGSDPSRQRMR